MRTIYYDITIPVGRIEPLDSNVRLVVPELPGVAADNLLLERKLREFFVNHFTNEFDRLYDRNQWVTRERRLAATIASMIEPSRVQTIE